MSGIKLSVKEVAHIAKLANLPLKEVDLEKYREQLSSVLGYVEVLGEVDTDNVEETAGVTGLSNIMRTVDGAGTRTLKQESALGQTKRSYKSFVVVSALLENRE